MHRVVIALGSNINPEENTQKALAILGNKFDIISKSKFIKTKPIGSVGQEYFINGSVLLETELSQDELKSELQKIESDLGRIRTEDKFAARTMDIDIVVWDNRIVDQDVFERDFLRKSILEVLPDFSIE